MEKAGGDPTQKDIIDEMIFAFSDVVTFYFDNTDLTYAVEDNFTDNAIAKQVSLDSVLKYFLTSIVMSVLYYFYC